MIIYAYKLKFEGPTHFGDTGIGLENVCAWVSSDTLFSAMVNALCAIEGVDKASNFLEPFKANPPFLISSLFLYSSERYFLPRPLAYNNISADLKNEMGKELRRLNWLDAEGFYKWLHYDELTKDDIEAMLTAQEEYKKAFSVEIRPRAAIDRATHNSSIYHCGNVHFSDNAGLYGLVAFNDDSAMEEFRSILTTVGELGLGGERSYGCGMFNVICFSEPSDMVRRILETNTDRYTLLSLYHPSAVELPSISENLISYDVVRKRGWITSGRNALTLKRKSVGFLTEGSILKVQPKGCLVDVTPVGVDVSTEVLNHNVYRYGYAFTAPSGG